MRKYNRRLASIAVAAALCAGMAQAMPITMTANAAEVIFQAECEDLMTTDGTSPQVWTDIYGQVLPGYTGDGFVYLTNETLTMTVEAPADGMYEIVVHYAQILDTAGRNQTISINGMDYMISSPYSDSFIDFDMGRYRLKEGENTIQFKPQYGYGCYDSVTISEAEMPELSVDSTLVDPNATPETQSLMNYLSSVYGKNIISGQQEIYGNGHTEDSPNGYDPPLGYESEFEWIHDNFGVYPAIRGFDFMNYNPLYGWDDQTTERCIEWVNERGGIATACWHINVPKDFASYTVGEEIDWQGATYKPDETDFDTANAIVPGTKEYEYVQLAIEDLAEQLLRLQEANVPIILRPYHEAEGNTNTDGSGSWFWWGKAGAEVYKQLWVQLYTTLTEEYDLHNIIWEYNSYDYATSPQWYPGDEYVDIVGYDKYNCVYNRHDGKTSGPNEDAISSTFYTLVDLTDGKKMVSMPENDTVPSLENIQVEKAYWLYFCIWYDNGQDNFLSGTDKNDPETLKEMYQSEFCITLDELPDDLYTNTDVRPITTAATDDTLTTSTTTTAEEHYLLGDFDRSGAIDGMDISLARQTLMQSDTQSYPLEISDINGDGTFSVADMTQLLHFLLGDTAS